MKHLNRMGRLWQRTPDYQQYAIVQAEKTQRMRGRSGHRVMNLVGLLVRTDPQPPRGRSILCVGCRETRELGVCHAAGFEPVVGIDLLSMDPGILPMDMHKMSFLDDTFDVVFACHSLEHAFDLDVALREIQRVTVPGGIWAVEVPVRFTPTLVDRHDLQSVEGVLERLAPFTDQVLYSDDSQTTNVARAIVRVKA